MRASLPASSASSPSLPPFLPPFLSLDSFLSWSISCFNCICCLHVSYTLERLYFFSRPITTTVSQDPTQTHNTLTHHPHTTPFSSQLCDRNKCFRLNEVKSTLSLLLLSSSSSSFSSSHIVVARVPSLPPSPPLNACSSKSATASSSAVPKNTYRHTPCCFPPLLGHALLPFMFLSI